LVLEAAIEEPPTEISFVRDIIEENRRMKSHLSQEERMALSGLEEEKKVLVQSHVPRNSQSVSERMRRCI